MGRSLRFTVARGRMKSRPSGQSKSYRVSCAGARGHPEFDVDFINEPDPHMPDLGARGIGDIGIVGVPATVANAIFHATGKRVRDLPITLDKLM
jgi:CO/xanthine dehydrogenase Mo-binding subunit